MTADAGGRGGVVLAPKSEIQHSPGTWRWSTSLENEFSHSECSLWMFLLSVQMKMQAVAQPGRVTSWLLTPFCWPDSRANWSLKVTGFPHGVCFGKRVSLLLPGLWSPP